MEEIIVTTENARRLFKKIERIFDNNHRFSTRTFYTRSFKKALQLKLESENSDEAFGPGKTCLGSHRMHYEKLETVFRPKKLIPGVDFWEKTLIKIGVKNSGTFTDCIDPGNRIVFLKNGIAIKNKVLLEEPICWTIISY